MLFCDPSMLPCYRSVQCIGYLSVKIHRFMLYTFTFIYSLGV
ncbi:unnamed protein product [Nezara viridula]|uniref:Uncharacterized protein n=1 Tax=Nezara viridula TaxID=85310 RepID=A0A9P0HBJ3_NEZVI|nr:unnamed protein product [Nezara viridula]